MKRKVWTVLAVLGLVVAASGCSLREVQLFLQIKGHPVSADQAKSIGDLVNQKQPAGCDTRYAAGASYSSTCVPNNVTSVHCAGTTGDGPAVRGPLTVTGWDSFGLDADGDKQACVDPVGSLDLVGQVADHIQVAGWALDPNTANSITVNIADNNVTTPVATSVSRSDLAGVFPGQGTNHGFGLSTPDSVSPYDGTSHQVCVTAVNVSAGADQKLPCKTIVMREAGAQAVGSGQSSNLFAGLIEGADRVPGGVHIRGYVVDLDSTPVVTPTLNISPYTSRPDVAITGSNNRADIAADYGVAPSSVWGFDFVQPTTGTSGAPFMTSSAACLFLGPTTFPPGPIMCRDLDS